MVLGARERVRCAFRIFDPFTKLRSTAAQAVGEDWYDLLLHKLSQGVRIEIWVTDFDPVARPQMHRGTWRSLRALWALGEASGTPERLDARALMHPARTGVLPSLLFWPRVRKRIGAEIARLNELSETDRAEELRVMPGLAEPLRERNGKLAVRAWPPVSLVPASHHQKIAVIDDDWVYVGGLDLDERRWDTPRHERKAKETWHDVQTLLTGPAVAEAHAHMDSYMDITRGSPGQGRLGATLLRTLSARRDGIGGLVSLAPHSVVDELRQAHLNGIRSARKFIYIETQFLRDQAIAKALVRAAETHPDLRVVIVLPAAPEDVAFEKARGADARFGEFLQARAVSKIAKALGDRLLIGAPAQHRRDNARGRDHLQGSPIIYVHAKVAVFDDHSAIISSANLNGRSLRWDTEAGVLLEDAETVRTLLRRCLDHWSGGGALDPHEAPERAVQELRSLVRRDATLPAEERTGLLLPYSVEPARRFGRNMPGIPEEMV